MVKVGRMEGEEDGKNVKQWAVASGESGREEEGDAVLGFTGSRINQPTG